ncbi:AAA-like domain-containing protein [Bradyrhizobium lablabi]|nr:AAA-like domain-containing protein [Bradyrhizobium lablabi]
MAGAKLFISYKRSIPADERLAHALRDALVASGHDVFIDVNMRVGTDWVAEIDKRIRWCDFLIVLLSEAAAESEMVQAEVRLARQARRRDGRPVILPVRVNYTGELGYELDAYLSRIQYLSWKGEVDTAKVLAGLQVGIEEAGAGHPKRSPSLDELPSLPDAGVSPARPRASEDPRVLLPPGGTIKIDDAFYVRRDADNNIAKIAAGNGQTIVIKAARQMGKSSLLIRYLAACKQADKQFAFIDFQSFSEAELAELPALLRRIAQIMLRAFRLNVDLPGAFATQLDFTYFVEDRILRALGVPVVVAMDEVDRLLGRPYQADFFSMLRHWHNERAQPMSAWENVDLAMVIATEPFMLIAAADRSPFNVTPAIEIEPFEQQNVREINIAYGGPLSDDQQDQLHELLSGHPYLTRLAFYKLVSSDLTFETLMEESSNGDGPFGEHLRSRIFMLQRQPELLGKMRSVASRATELDMDTFYRLHAAGLVVRRGKNAAPSNMLYAASSGRFNERGASASGWRYAELAPASLYRAARGREILRAAGAGGVCECSELAPDGQVEPDDAGRPAAERERYQVGHDRSCGRAGHPAQSRRLLSWPAEQDRARTRIATGLEVLVGTPRYGDGQSAIDALLPRRRRPSGDATRRHLPGRNRQYLEAVVHR